MTTAQLTAHAQLTRTDDPLQRERGALDEALLLESAGSSCWRVCDSRIPCGEGRFLAFVEHKDDVFEVMQIADDFLWSAFPTMHAALTHIADTNSDIAPLRSSGELSWLK